MYTTIEADIENGRIKGAEISRLPKTAHVLITLISPTQPPGEKKPDWNKIKPMIGKLQLRTDTVEWQRKLRAEWD